MTPQKFDEFDRRKIIETIEHYFCEKLSRFGRRKKYLRDQHGKSYWVLGGSGDWHGFQSDMIEVERERGKNGVLVIAKRFRNRIDIFAGQLQPLIDNVSSLSHAENGDYQFNISILDNVLFFKELPSTLLKLRKISEVTYPEAQKLSDKKVAEVKLILDNLPPEQRRQILERWQTDVVVTVRNSSTGGTSEQRELASTSGRHTELIRKATHKAPPSNLPYR